MKPNNSLRTFKGAVVIVTGAASGIGAALARELGLRGSSVILADRELEPAQQTASVINASGGSARAVEVDVTDFPSLKALVNETAQEHGRLDYMFNNAGVSIFGNTTDLAIDDWKYIMDVNVHGIIQGATTAFDIMKKQGFGHIVNTASISGLIPSPDVLAYATSKHAVVGFSTSLRAEAAGYGIRVSVLCPGVVRTPILEGGGLHGRIVTKLPPHQEAVYQEMLEKLKPMEPGVFARKALKDIAKNKPVIVHPSKFKTIWRINRFFPALGLKIHEKYFYNNMKNSGRL